MGTFGDAASKRDLLLNEIIMEEIYTNKISILSKETMAFAPVFNVNVSVQRGMA